MRWLWVVTAAALAGCNRPTGPQTAELLHYNVVFDEETQVRRYWLPVSGPVTLLYEQPNDVRVTIQRVGGASVSTTPAEQIGELPLEQGIGGLSFTGNREVLFVTFTRSDAGGDRVIDAEVALFVPDAQQAFSAEAFELATTLRSPLLSFPDGAEVTTLPAGATQPDFAAYVDERFGYEYPAGINSLIYVGTELTLLTCGLPVAGAAPTGAPGPQPPFGAQHNENYCGISVFIHSMDQYFPGALSPNSSTNPADWDKAGDDLDHSRTFGTRGCKLVDNVNQNYRDGNAALDGKKYCAVELDDLSIGNLQAWAEDCNLKLLIYDLPNFGHWVDVVAIRGDTLEIQDYGQKYDAPYDSDDENVDFTGAGGSTMGDNFDADDPVAGDAPGEIVEFYVVCECKNVGGSLVPPDSTRSGKPLKK